ncbi:hypothetical protein GCM10027037_18480 [Mucilaginibacter koreensis]
MREYKKFALTLLFILLASITFAQQPGDLPCEDADPTLGNVETCPLDTWVYVMITITVIPAVYHLYQQKKPAIK